MDTHAAKIQRSLFLATTDPPKPSAFATQHLRLQRKDSLRASKTSISLSPSISPISPETSPEASTLISPKIQQLKRPGLERTSTLKTQALPRGSIFNPVQTNKRRDSELIPMRRSSRSTTQKMQSLKPKNFEPAPAPAFMHTPSLFKEYKYRKSQNRDSVIKETGNNEQRELKRMSIFSLSAFGSRVTDTRPMSPNPSRASKAYRKKLTLMQSGMESPSPKNRNLLSPLATPAHRFAANRRDSLMSAYTGSSFSSDDEEHMTPERRRLRNIFKRGLLVVYFVGVMISFKNKVKVYGALRPIEYLEEFESIQPKNTHKSILPIIPTSMFSMIWALTIIFCLMLTAVLTPIYISFADDQNMFFYYLNLVMDFGFGIDIVVNLLSAYYDDDRNLITDFRKIIFNYMRMWFWIDIIAVVPVDEIMSSLDSLQPSHKIFRLLRFPRLYKLFKILRLLKVTKIFSASRSFNKLNKKLSLNVLMTKIIKILFNFAFLNHLVGCLWFYVARLEDFSPDSWAGKAGITDSDTLTQYIASLYWSFQTLTTVGYGDLAPGTPLERSLASIWIVFGVLIYTFTVGNLSALLFGYQMKAESLKEKLVSFERFALKANIPDFLTQKVRRFYEINHKENACHWIDPTDKLKSLPANLKTSLLLFSYYAFIKKIKVLQINANLTAALLVHFKVQKLKAGEIIYRQDDPSDEIYFITKGSVKFITEKAKGIFSLSEGTYFGELEAFEGVKRWCFCKALAPTVILICPKVEFLKTLEDFPDIETQMKKIAVSRKGKLNEKVARIQKAEIDAPDDPNLKPIAKTTEYINKVLLKIPDPEVRFQKRRRERRLTRPKSTLHVAPTSPTTVQSPDKIPERRMGRKRTLLSLITPRGYFGMSMDDLDSQIGDEESGVGSSNTLMVPTRVDLEKKKSRFEPKSPLKELKSPVREVRTVTKLNDISSPSLTFKKTFVDSVDNLLSQETKYKDIGSIMSEPREERPDSLLDHIDVGTSSFTTIPRNRDYRSVFDNYEHDVIEELEEVPSPVLQRGKKSQDKPDHKTSVEVEEEEETKPVVIVKKPFALGNNLLSLVTGQGLKNFLKQPNKIAPISERSKRKESDTPTKTNSNSKNYQKFWISSSESDLELEGNRRNFA